MISIGDRNINMRRGWIAQFEDGSVICEDDMVWSRVPNKKKITKMLLKWEDRVWSLDNKENYTAPKKRGYVDVNASGFGNARIDSRTIGYYDQEGKCRVYMRVDEATGRMSYETEPF